jgi:multidrug resistance efflux pump
MELNMNFRDIHPKMIISGLVILVVGMLSGCAAITGSSTGTSGAVASVGNLPANSTNNVPSLSADAGSSLVFDGNIIPHQSVDLAFNTTGQVSEVLVSEGDTVKDGQVLARLRGTSSPEALQQAVSDAQAAIAADQYNLVDAKQKLNALYTGAELATAQAQQDMANAQISYNKAVTQLNSGKAAADPNTIASTQAEVVLAQANVDKAQATYDEISHLPSDNLRRANALVALNNAKTHLTQVTYTLNNLLAQITDTNLALLEANVAQTKATLDDDTRKYNTLKNGPDPDQVALAQAQVDQVQAQLQADQAQLATAQSNLADTELKAPFAGKVVNLALKPGEVATAGKTVVTVADFSNWYVETANLDELSVVDIAVGQQVTVVPDSLQNVTLSGVVESISDSYTEDKTNNKITYTARIRLENIDPRLRWGMTVAVDFGKAQ